MIPFLDNHAYIYEVVVPTCVGGIHINTDVWSVVTDTSIYLFHLTYWNCNSWNVHIMSQASLSCKSERFVTEAKGMCPDRLRVRDETYLKTF